jgi:hypothetical protein
MRSAAAALVLLAWVASDGATPSAAERHWRTGACTKVDVSRQLVDFGPGQGPFGPPPPAGQMNMKAMAEVRIYVIETADLYIEAKDISPVGRKTLDVAAGEPITFALEKSTLYVRDPSGAEHKLRITKKKSK